jgi:hypothetical protein
MGVASGGAFWPMHDNGRYVKFEGKAADAARPPLDGTKKIRRAGLRFVHRFR